MKALKELCGACGRRRGRHFGGNSIRICWSHEDWEGDVPIGYQGTFWVPTGVYEDEGRVIDTNSIQFRANANNPNTMFKIRKRKT